MKEYTLKLTKDLKYQLFQQWLFLSSFNLNIAKKFLLNYNLSVNSLKYFPNRNQSVFSNKKYRRMFFFNHYIIIYFVDNLHNIVYIKYVFSTKQNYDKFIS